MRGFFAARTGLSLTVAALLAGFIGCARKDNPNDRYVPSEDKARQALEASLKAWQRGEPPGLVSSEDVPIQVVDSGRRAGQRLRDFTILGNVPGDTPRCFAVRLEMEEPREVKQDRFIVMGLVPLWVMPHADLDCTNHMEHPVGPEKSSD